MARILCVWEMGSALGHLSNLKPFVDAAQAAGHQVILALKELHNIAAVLPNCALPLFQAPYLMRPPRTSSRLLSYSQLVLERFETDAELTALCQAWDTLFDAVAPDVVVYDFAPSALIASLGKPWRKWVIGNGFFIPRGDGPFLGLFPRVKKTAENAATLRNADATLLARVNHVLHRRGIAAIADVRQLFSQADSQLLMTLPELDAFGARPGADYVGIPPQMPSQAPRWPAGGGQKIFAYLAKFPALEAFLAALDGLNASTLIYSRDIPPALQARFPRLGFVDSPLDLEQVNAEADLVVNMGSHTTCAQALMAGVPQLVIPRRQEQYFTAARIASQGRGVLMPANTERPAAAIARALDLPRANLAFDPERRRRLSGPLLAARIGDLLAGLEP